MTQPTKLSPELEEALAILSVTTQSHHDSCRWRLGQCNCGLQERWKAHARIEAALREEQAEIQRLGNLVGAMEDADPNIHEMIWREKQDAARRKNNE